MYTVSNYKCTIKFNDGHLTNTDNNTTASHTRVCLSHHPSVYLYVFVHKSKRRRERERHH